MAEGDDKPTRRTRGTTTGRSSPRSHGSTGESRGSSPEGPNPLGLDQPPPFEPPQEGQPAQLGGETAYEPPAPELIEWTPERAGAIVRAGGFLLHNADSIAQEPEALELWRATEADVEAIGPPLARILNRYAPARRLAGVSDEAELAFGLMAYARRNLATRGRAVQAKKEREAAVSGPQWGPDVAPSG